MDYNYSNSDRSNSVSSGERDGAKLKICGMNKNTLEIASLKPDYLGFIFWEPSSRYFEDEIPDLPHSIKKVGVFVDASIKEIGLKVKSHGLLMVQLHGKESPAFCDELKKHIPHVKIIKVFSIKDDFDFGRLRHYEDVCDFYLFDTKGKLPGGNGYTFDWKVLKKYPSEKPYFLSGGIGLEEIESIKKFMMQPEAKFCHAIDVNSKFEDAPGLKNVAKLEVFKEQLRE